MKIYRVNLWDYEEQYDYQFTHRDIISQDDFRKDVKQCLIQSVKDVLLNSIWEDDGLSSDIPVDQRKSWIGVPQWFDAAMPKMQELGYSYIDYVEINFCSTDIIRKSDNDRMKSLMELVGEDVYSQISAHNDSLYESRYSRFNL